MSHSLRVVTVATMAMGALAACSKNDTATTEPAATASTIVAVSGTDAHLQVGHVADTLSVFVASSSGSPLSGAVVTWQASGTDATLSAPTSTTDANGIARVVLTTGTQAGSGAVVATTGTVSPVTIYLTELPGAPAKLVALSPSVDSVSVGQSFTFPAVSLQDAYGNAIAGATIVVSEPTAMDGDALVDRTLTTDANGVVQETFVPASMAGVRALQFATADGSLSVTYTVDVVATDDGTTTTGSAPTALHSGR